MTKKVAESAIRTDHARPLVAIDTDTLAIIDAQCEEHGADRAKFVSAAVRLFLDFSYIARVVGKDVFAFRDELIRALVKSRGKSDLSAEEALGEIAKKDNEKLGAAGKKPHAQAIGHDKFDELLKEINELKFAFYEFKNSLDIASDEKHFKHHRSGGGEQAKLKRHAEPPVSVDELANELKNAHPPSYKDKRKKLNKLKF